jgi:RNA polymerase sigma factor (sigma-70 family)
MSPQSRQSFLLAIEESHGSQLRRFLYSRLPGSSADVPDLVQEIFLRLLRIKDHEAIRNPQAYLFTIANHVLHQHALQRSTRPELMDPIEVANQAQTGTAPDPADELEFTESLERVGRELKKLSPRAYAALVMYRCEGMTLTEIGQRLGVSHVMVRKYLAKAIEYCDQRLEDSESGSS